MWQCKPDPSFQARGHHKGEGLIAMSKSGAKRIRVGIIGANPDRGWAAPAHIPALKSLADDFEITALSTTRRESADAAARLFGVPAAFDNHTQLVNSPVVDVVAVTVKVPHHLELATAALEAGKAVYCEWPLGNCLHEAENLAALAKKQDVLAVAGLHDRYAPEVGLARDLGTDGYLQLTATGGQAQNWELDDLGGNGDQTSPELLPVPEQYQWAPPRAPGPSTNVAQAYAHFARDYRTGTHLCPTFDDAVTRHRMLDAIETAAATGRRQTLG